jgi:hypothetical protein
LPSNLEGDITVQVESWVSHQCVQAPFTLTHVCPDPDPLVQVELQLEQYTADPLPADPRPLTDDVMRE